MLRLTISFLPLLSLCSLLTSVNQSLFDPNWVVFNCPVSAITGNMDVVPFQYTQILDARNRLLRLRYNFTTGGFPQGMVSTYVKQNSANEQFRVDGQQDIKIELQINLTQGGTETIAYDSYLQVSYWYRQLQFIIFKVYYWKYPTLACQSPTTNLSGLQFAFKSLGLNHYQLQVCSASPKYLNLTFDLTELDRYVLSRGLIREWDSRRNVQIYIRVQGAGEVTFRQNAYYPSRIQYTSRQQKFVGKYTMVNQPFIQGLTHLEFLNMSLPVNGSTQGIISEAYFNYHEPKIINGHNWVLIGLFYGDWKTPLNSYGLPAEVHTDINMYVNFRFTAEQAAAPVGRGASYLLNFRDDYNQSTQSFTNQNTIYISRQIIITAWASETHRSGAKGIAISEISYFGVIWKIRLFAERKQYLIDAQSNLNSMKNFDVFVFVRYLRDAFQVFRTMEFLVTVQTGFRYNTGRGKFIVHELEYEYNPNFQTSKIDLQIQEQALKGMFSCYLLTENSDTCQKAQTISNIIENSISIPSIGTIMGISPIISLVDEFALYAYHSPKYDRGFEYVSKVCSEWTDNKWVPPFMSDTSEKIGKAANLVSNTVIDGQIVRQPNKFYQFGMKNNFYRNVSNFLVISLPINLLIFLILMGLEWLLRRYRIFKPIQVILKPFRSFVCFFSAMFAENMTYLSFHCFLQLYRFVPYAHGQHTFPSSILCLIMLFTTLITAIFLSFAAWIYASKTFQIDYCKTSNSKSYLFFGFALTGKFAAGFAHAYVDNPKHIVLGLLIINCFVFGVLIYCWKAMQFKTYLSVYFVVYLGKVVMHLQLLLQICIPQLARNTGPSASQNSLIIVLSIFGLMLIINLIKKFKTLHTFVKSKAPQPKNIFIITEKTVQATNNEQMIISEPKGAKQSTTTTQGQYSRTSNDSIQRNLKGKPTVQNQNYRKSNNQRERKKDQMSKMNMKVPKK